MKFPRHRAGAVHVQHVRGRRDGDLLKPRVVVPVHYEGWSHFRENRDVFEPALAATGADVRWLTPGEATAVD